MFRRPALAALPVLIPVTLVCAAALGGCLTQRVRPPPSPAVVQARAAVAAKPAACSAGGLETLSPVATNFGFDDAQVSEVGQQHLAQAATWLNCHPGVEVVVLPSADNHGSAAHQTELATNRAQAVSAALRAAGAKAAVIHVLPAGAPDTVQGAHLVIRAAGRGW